MKVNQKENTSKTEAEENILNTKKRRQFRFKTNKEKIKMQLKTAAKNVFSKTMRRKVKPGK
ncbi:MAG TPA: hypothetical protein VJ455_05625 [Ignavibacteria bacterium]|nr:hypothetical protein [Ignavibacteria bacterium]